MFKPVDPKLNLPKLEEEILDFWDANKIFEKSLKNRRNDKPYAFYDGPPFATGTPHYGHIVASLMKDVVPRYWTMKGKLVERKWGWDCHGLPIENIAERELGIKTKKQIEGMGIDKFNQFCRSKVLGYVDEWKKVIRRLGRWADMENPYKTMDLDFMESVWWVFKQLWEKQLIYEGYRSMHICPRCETTLSQMEVAEGYKDIKDLSVTAEFELLDSFSKGSIGSLQSGSGQTRTFVLAWTTTPWTLLGNVALAINKNIIYCKVKSDGMDNYYILAKDRLEEIFKGDEYKIIEEFSGQDLVGKKYKPLFEIKKNIKNAENGWKIVAADFVTTKDGTGVVHIAPAFGQDDMNLGKENNLPFIQHVQMDGIIKSGYGEFSGLSAKPNDDVESTDKKIIKYLKKNNVLFLSEEYTHSYPHCWRCDTPLINYATSSWFVAVEKIKQDAINLSKEINWSPEHMKAGRFGKWLEGARDWSISRQRYWASVIPIWKCNGKAEITNDSAQDRSALCGKSQITNESQNLKTCNNLTVIGSVKELEELSGQKVNDLHKHIVDKIMFKCQKCSGEMKRVPDVLDTWFDSGSMPYGELHYPFENKNNFEAKFPAEFIAEGDDQTRAWFYYLHIISTAIFNKPAYLNVVVNGIVLSNDGKKMSKRLQNYPDPMEMFNKYGADSLRYYLLSSPVMMAENLNFLEEDVAKIYRGVLRMIWNSYYFFVLYASIDKWLPKKNYTKSEKLLDRWIISELNQLIKETNESMNKYDLLSSSRQFQKFIDDLSNWYIRRSRRRFWKSENDRDKENAYNTLYKVLLELSKLMAPFTPFISESIYKNLTENLSVHLENYPDYNKESIDQNICKKMNQVRKIVEISLAKRSESKIKVRQPLSSLKYGGDKLGAEYEEIIAEEINIKEVVWDKQYEQDQIDLDIKISDQLVGEGRVRELIRNIQSLRKKTGFSVEDRIIVYFQSKSEKLISDIEKFDMVITKETLALSLENSKADVEGQEMFNVDGIKIWVGVKREN